MENVKSYKSSTAKEKRDEVSVRFGIFQVQHYIENSLNFDANIDIFSRMSFLAGITASRWGV